MVQAFWLGIQVTFFYDWLRILRRLFPHSMWKVSAEDLLFWVFCGVKVFELMHREGNGSLRWFAVMGAVLGMEIYLKLVSPFFIKYSVKLMRPVVDSCRKFKAYLKKKLTAFVRVLKIKLSGKKKEVLDYGRRKQEAGKCKKAGSRKEKKSSIS